MSSLSAPRRTPVSYWSRYAGMMVRYGTPRKFVNAARAWMHYKAGSQRVSSRPCFLKVEVSRKCRVKCRYCNIAKDDLFYPLKRYRRLVDALAPHLFMVSLYDIGEPLENPDLLQYIRFAHERRVGTVVSTSLSVHRTERFWDQLASSGLDRLIVAIDGTSEDVYRIYRTGGNFGLVLANLRTLLRHRSRHRSPLHVEWQMLDLPWNGHQHTIAAKMAQAMGCDGFRLIAEATQRRACYAEEAVTRERNCLLPYIVLIVNAYNQARPCYKIYAPGQSLGELDPDDVDAVWNGAEIARIRDRHLISERPNCRTCQE